MVARVVPQDVTPGQLSLEITKNSKLDFSNPFTFGIEMKSLVVGMTSNTLRFYKRCRPAEGDRKAT
jgi:hypothetical protein